MGTFGTGKRRRSVGERGIPRLHLDLHALVAKQLHAGASMRPATPVTPEDRSRTDRHWMQQHAHLTRFGRRPAIPLALLAQGTGTTTSDTGRIDHTQTPISFLAPFVCRKFLIGRTAQRAIVLEGEVLPRETANFEGGGNRGLAIATGVELLLFGLGQRRSKLGGAYRIRMQLVPQLQTEVPHPLRHHLPALLSPGRVRAPAIGILFGILICQRRFKGAAMQVQFDHIGSGERLLRQVGKKEFVNDVRTRDANRTLLVACWMGRHHHAAWYALGSHRYLRTIVEATHHLTFRTLLELVGGQVQTRLDERVIERCVLFASCHEGEASEIGEHGSCAILSVEPQQRVRLWELARREIARDRGESLAQFRSVASVASVAKLPSQW